MRQILFRGKRLDNGEWVYGDYIHGVGMHYGNSYILPNQQWLPTDCDPLDGYKVDPSTVSQFTGLLDRNGKEIYEGDILNNYDEPNPLIVKWDGSGCFFGLFNQDGDCESDFTSLEGRLGVAVDAEIVGNIYDNPEILKSA